MKKLFTHPIFAAVAAAVIGAMAIAAEEEKSPEVAASDVLIIWASGASPAMQGVDTVTLATPKDRNVMTLSAQLGEALKKQGLTVRLAEALEVKDPAEIVAAKVVVLASPSYFSNMSWRMKKVIDEKFYATRSMEGRLNGKPCAGLAMAGGDGAPALELMGRAVQSCGGKWAETISFSGRGSAEDDAKRIEEFAGKLAALAKPAE